jgi:hypothetical protein
VTTQELAQQNLRDQLRKMGEQERDEIIVELCDRFNLTAETIAKIPQEIESLENDLDDARSDLKEAQDQIKSMKESGLPTNFADHCS